MNKLAYILAYSDPETAFDIQVKFFDNPELEKNAAINKEALWEDVANWFKKTWADEKGRKMLLGLGGAGLGAGLGGLVAGRKGALVGAGMGGLGGYYWGPGMFKSPTTQDNQKVIDDIAMERRVKSNEMGSKWAPDVYDMNQKTNKSWEDAQQSTDDLYKLTGRTRPFEEGNIDPFSVKRSLLNNLNPLNPLGSFRQTRDQYNSLVRGVPTLPKVTSSAITDPDVVHALRTKLNDPTLSPHRKAMLQKALDRN